MTSLPGRSSLLAYAASTLNPKAFTHPVWVRFGRIEDALSPDLIRSLLQTAYQLEDPGTACQVLLICAVYLQQSGQHFDALRVIQEAIDQCQRSHLTRETLWALWGGCALSVQQGKHEQAARYLVDLQAALSEQNEWVLADFIDILRQTFFQDPPVRPGNSSTGPAVQPIDNILARTLDWLQEWGKTVHPSGSAGEWVPASGAPVHLVQASETHPNSAGQRWKDLGSRLLARIVLAGRSFSIRMGRGERKTVAVQEAQPEQRDKGTSPLTAVPRRRRTDATLYRGGTRDPAQAAATVPVAVHMLGTFRMTIGDLVVNVPASRGLSLLKYLLLHHRQTVSREILMEVFWPDAEPETARNNLNVAMHSLRKTLRTSIFLPVILFKDGSYVFDSSLKIWLDVEAFEKCLQSGHQLEARNQITAAVSEYEAALSLYQGDFLEQNLYEEWTVVNRERLRVAYQDTLDRLTLIYFNQGKYGACILLCQRILAMDDCSENAHRRLMRCYSRQGQSNLALRQYQACVEAIQRELNTSPEPSTVELYEQIRRGQHV